MAQLQAKKTTCKHCGEVFLSKGTYQVHFRRNHQDNIKKHSESRRFECVCGKSYEIYQSIQRHQKSCHEWKIHQENESSGSDVEEEGIVYCQHQMLMNRNSAASQQFEYCE